MPKRSSSASSRRSSSKSARSRASSKGRQLSDIAEESVVHSIEAHDLLPDDFTFRRRTRSDSKKRSFDAAQLAEPSLPTPPASRSVSRSTSRKGSAKSEEGRSAKRRKTSAKEESAQEATVDESLAAETEAEVEAFVEAVNDQDLENGFATEQPGPTPSDEPALVTRTTPSTSLYTSPPSLLYWTNTLDTSLDTETLALNLIELTLSPPNWHISLSGVIQPAACFLFASLLTRRQNLVEDIVAALEEYVVGFEEVVKGYKVLWEMREVLAGEEFGKGVVGEYEERLATLPSAEMLMGEEGVDEEYV